MRLGKSGIGVNRRDPNLLRTGIQFDLEQQNRDLLADMNQRARLQLRLQRTVQGLSIAALSYYLAGLVTYVAKGAKDAGLLPHSVTAEMVTALTLPAVVFAAWAFMERVRRRAGVRRHNTRGLKRATGEACTWRGHCAW